MKHAVYRVCCSSGTRMAVSAAVILGVLVLGVAVCVGLGVLKEIGRIEERKTEERE